MRQASDAFELAGYTMKMKLMHDAATAALVFHSYDGYDYFGLFTDELYRPDKKKE